jgi:hypothetical protein
MLASRARPCGTPAAGQPPQQAASGRAAAAALLAAAAIAAAPCRPALAADAAPGAAAPPAQQVERPARARLSEVAAAVERDFVQARRAPAGAEQGAPKQWHAHARARVAPLNTTRRSHPQQGQYYVTGNLTPSLYEPDALFIDPTTRVQGGRRRAARASPGRAPRPPRPTPHAPPPPPTRRRQVRGCGGGAF